MRISHPINEGEDVSEPTLKQWKRRALAAEAELESIRELRRHDKEFELVMHRKLAAATVALQEAQEAVQWALEVTQ